jgi:hypothetical protein
MPAVLLLTTRTTLSRRRLRGGRLRQHGPGGGVAARYSIPLSLSFCCIGSGLIVRQSSEENDTDESGFDAAAAPAAAAAAAASAPASSQPGAGAGGAAAAVAAAAAAAAGALRKRMTRFVSGVTVLFNLSNEPWFVYFRLLLDVLVCNGYGAIV